MKPAFLAGAATRANHIVTLLCVLAGVLVFPLVLLLFAQWPLRELLQAFSRQANDAAQLIFAVYMAVAITAASRGRVHLASLRPDHLTTKRPRWQAWALLACTAPWAIFMLWAGWPVVAASVSSLERFGETLNPGYFIVKLAMMLLLVLVLLDRILQPLQQDAP